MSELTIGVHAGEWLLPVLAWTRPDGGDVRRPPALVLRADGDGHMRLAPPDGWRDLDTFHAVEVQAADGRLRRMQLAIPGRTLGGEAGTTVTFSLTPDDPASVTLHGEGAGAFVGTVADERATGTWSHDPEQGLRIEVDRDGARSAFSWMTRRDDDEVTGLVVVIHHQVGEHVGGMQLRLG